MSMKMEDDIERWTAKRKSALVLDIIQGKIAAAEASRRYDLSPSEVEQWVDDGKRGMENALRAHPQDVREQYERQLTKLCRWLNVPRRTVYYKPEKASPKLDPEVVAPIKALIEESPSFGYRTVAHLLGFNRNTVQRVFQLMGWQVRKRPVGFMPRIQALPSVATRPDERWSTDLCRVWAGRDGWATLALVMQDAAFAQAKAATALLCGWFMAYGKRAPSSSRLDATAVPCA